jgi:flagellar assembly factor FliW
MTSVMSNPVLINPVLSTPCASVPTTDVDPTMTGMMTVSTPMIEFVTAVPGFPDARSWMLEPWGDDPMSPFAMLSCRDVEGLAFVVVPPFPFFPDYEPDLDDATVQALDLKRPEDAAVYVVLTLGESLGDITANLLGPIVVNLTNRRAAQPILHQPGLSTSVPLVSATD